MDSEFSVENTKICADLLKRPVSERGPGWSAELELAFPTAIFVLGDPKSVFNPEGMPHANWQFPPANSSVIGYSLAHNLIDLLRIGSGVAIGTKPDVSDPIFELTYGDLVNYALGGKLMTPWQPDLWLERDPNATPGAIAHVQVPAPVFEGTPNASIIPPVALGVINNYLAREFPDLGDLRIAEFEGEKFALAIRSGDRAAEALAALSWMVPFHYPLLSV